MAWPDTRSRILVTSLLLFNDNGEPGTTTNEIADEADISPGNLHYHFRKKADLVEALLAEFQADAGNVLQAPAGGEPAIEEFRGFLQLLIELLAAYRFLIRDTETLIAAYPKVRRAIRGFVNGLYAVLELHVVALRDDDIIRIAETDVADLCRALALVAIFSERLDRFSGVAVAVDKTAARIAGASIGILLPHAEGEAADRLRALLEQYRA